MTSRGSLARLITIALCACMSAAVVRAQSSAAQPALRMTIDSVAAGASLAPLSSGAPVLPAEREVRVYIGFDGNPVGELIRIWTDGTSAYGWIGLWWGSAARPSDPTAPAPARTTSGARALRQRVATTFHCHTFHMRHAYQSCTVPVKRVDWSRLLADIDALHADGVGARMTESLANDATLLVVESAGPDGYHLVMTPIPQHAASTSAERSTMALARELQSLYPASRE